VLNVRDREDTVGPPALHGHVIKEGDDRLVYACTQMEAPHHCTMAMEVHTDCTRARSGIVPPSLVQCCSTLPAS
jgi:hypothetical protein